MECTGEELTSWECNQEVVEIPRLIDITTGMKVSHD